ncbi:hypothetical protein N9B17_05610, partial [Rhodopirellula sp.]|nr:hypothetical protein [Rhodopirellula sp.]
CSPNQGGSSGGKRSFDNFTHRLLRFNVSLTFSRLVELVSNGNARVWDWRSPRFLRCGLFVIALSLFFYESTD